MRALAALVSICLLVPSPAVACSSSVSTYFAEVTRAFSVAVRFEGKPLADAKVSIFAFSTAQPVSSATTARDGMVRFRDLRPGKYFLDVRHHGISAGGQQIEIRARASAQAISRLDYRWGEEPTAVRQVSGTIMEMRPQGATLLERTFPAAIPISGAHIQLRHPTNDSFHIGASDERGEFAVAGVPNGIYVMHVKAGVSPNDSADFLVQVTPSAPKDSVQLVRGDVCGSTVLLLQ